MQSANRRHHSAETGLLLVHDDIVKRFNVLLQLDCSAAFDKICRLLYHRYRQ